MQLEYDLTKKEDKLVVNLSEIVEPCDEHGEYHSNIDYGFFSMFSRQIVNYRNIENYECRDER